MMPNLKQKSKIKPVKHTSVKNGCYNGCYPGATGKIKILKFIGAGNENEKTGVQQEKFRNFLRIFEKGCESLKVSSPFSSFLHFRHQDTIRVYRNRHRCTIPATDRHNRSLSRNCRYIRVLLYFETERYHILAIFQVLPGLVQGSAQ